MLVGVVMPDVPLFSFYFVQKVTLGTAQDVVWRDAYYRDDEWACIDLFNSVPVTGVGLLPCWCSKSCVGISFFSGMLLHLRRIVPSTTTPIVTFLRCWNDASRVRCLTGIQSSMASRAQLLNSRRPPCAWQ